MSPTHSAEKQLWLGCSFLPLSSNPSDNCSISWLYYLINNVNSAKGLPIYVLEAPPPYFSSSSTVTSSLLNLCVSLSSTVNHQSGIRLPRPRYMTEWIGCLRASTYKSHVETPSTLLRKTPIKTLALCVTREAFFFSFFLLYYEPIVAVGKSVQSGNFPH